MLRKPLTWISSAALLLTTAAAGQAYFAADPAAAMERTGPALPTAQAPVTSAVSLQSLQQLSATQQSLTEEVQQLRDTNRELLSRLEGLQAAIAPAPLTGNSG